MFRNPAYMKTLLFAFFSLFLVVSIIFFPQQAFESSLRGLTIWWDVVFPALLPFFITAELLMGFGVVHFLGVLLEPLMRPLFRIPGVGGFVMSMSLASGYPMGAKLTVRLREQELITRAEGERLVSIASTSGPLFMIGAVAVGFFHDPGLGIIIALAHYISALCVGLFMRFHRYHDQERGKKEEDHTQQALILRALQAMHRARMKDRRPLGSLMGEAVQSSIQTLLMIGGFMIIFSVLINILDIVGINQLLTAVLSLVLVPIGLNPDLVASMIAGVFEMTLGSQTASEADTQIALVQKVALAGAIIAWSGLSVHAQVASILAQTDIRYLPYLIARVIHAVFACVWTFILWLPLQAFIQHSSVNVFLPEGDASWHAAWDRYTYFSYTLLLIFIIVFIFTFLILYAQRKAARQKTLFKIR